MNVDQLAFNFSATLPILPNMNKLSSNMQRLIMAFTTGLFLACAANVSKAVEITPVSAVNP